MQVSKKAPEPIEDEIHIVLSLEEARALRMIVGTNGINEVTVWEGSFWGQYGRRFDNFKLFSKNLFNSLRDLV